MKIHHSNKRKNCHNLDRFNYQNNVSQTHAEWTKLLVSERDVTI